VLLASELLMNYLKIATADEKVSVFVSNCSTAEHGATLIMKNVMANPAKEWGISICVGSSFWATTGNELTY